MVYQIDTFQKYYFESFLRYEKAFQDEYKLQQNQTVRNCDYSVTKAGIKKLRSAEFIILIKIVLFKTQDNVH